MTSPQFRNIVWKYYKEHGRHDLPWRKTTDPYRILVSEVMLQQTQVERVKPYYAAWLKQFPTVSSLAKAPLGEVLKAWQGLGYNRRGKMLHEAAKAIVKHGGFPKTAEELQKLPGIGPYTARAVMAFAHNADVVFIETNIRTAVTHHFFPRKNAVADAEILAILAKAHPKGKSREWYAALMDYGAHLKRTGVRLNAKAKGYTKQKAFTGSDRQARGAIVKELAKGTATKPRLLGLLGDDRKDQLALQLTKLEKEGMVKKARNSYALP
ncbi:MAG: A/G-specific adenine glycosylase [Parcubacteria group bacterium]|nr:A/G-specific adenine glycosylase [Parcubacteria group bacterium]